MSNTDIKKKEQLGMAQGTARNKLVKLIMFDMARKLKLDTCFRCNKAIVKVNEFSIEHKIPWLDSEEPKELYFNLDNIAFSHHSCNVSNARPRQSLHPSFNHYRKGCRCEGCKKCNRDMVYKYRNNK